MKLNILSMTALLLFAAALALTFLPACARNPKQDDTVVDDPNTLPKYDWTKATCGISGKVVFDGTRIVPGESEIECPAMGGGKHKRKVLDMVMGEDLGIQNAFVYITNAGKFNYNEVEGPNAFTETKVLDQKNCDYIPRVVGLMLGQPVTIKSSDANTPHNVRSKALGSNYNMFGVDEVSTQFKRPIIGGQPHQVVCDVHGWMICHVFALKHPFYCVTNEKGEFELPKVQPGDYVLEVWHEKLKKSKTYKVKLEDGGADNQVIKIAPAELKK